MQREDEAFALLGRPVLVEAFDGVADHGLAHARAQRVGSVRGQGAHAPLHPGRVDGAVPTRVRAADQPGAGRG